MEMPTPTDAHRKLAMFAGDWRGPETMHPSPWDPKGFEGKGRSVNRVALDGFALLHDYEQSRDGRVTFRGHGVFSYSPDQDRYTLHWFDSMGSGVNVFTGVFEGDALSMTSASHGGHSRCVMTLTAPNAYTFEMAMSQDGEHWKPVMEGRYTRSG